MATRDSYSNFKFFQAVNPQDIGSGVAYDGPTIDTKGYETVTMIANCTTTASGSQTSAAHLILQHGLTSAAGVSVWSDVPPSQMLHSVVGENGAFSTSAQLGIWQYVGGESDASTASNVYMVGYTGSYRYVRMRVSNESAAAHGFSMGAVAMLGEPHNWPVNDPIDK